MYGYYCKYLLYKPALKWAGLLLVKNYNYFLYVIMHSLFINTYSRYR